MDLMCLQFCQSGRCPHFFVHCTDFCPVWGKQPLLASGLLARQRALNRGIYIRVLMADHNERSVHIIFHDHVCMLTSDRHNEHSMVYTVECRQQISFAANEVCVAAHTLLTAHFFARAVGVMRSSPPIHRMKERVSLLWGMKKLRLGSCLTWLSQYKSPNIASVHTLGCLSNDRAPKRPMASPICNINEVQSRITHEAHRRGGGA